MARHGHPYVPIAEGNFTQFSGEHAMTRLLAEHPLTDGVFVANDLMALGALHALRHHDRRVPADPGQPLTSTIFDATLVVRESA